MEGKSCKYYSKVLTLLRETLNLFSVRITNLIHNRQEDPRFLCSKCYGRLFVARSSTGAQPWCVYCENRKNRRIDKWNT